MGDLIRELRVKLAISQTELAQAVSTNQSTISRIEQNGLNSNYRLIYKILLFLKSKKFNGDQIIRSFLSNNVLEFMVQLMQHKNLRQKINADPCAVVQQLIAVST